MASESIAHSASWAIDSEPIRARGITVKYPLLPANVNRYVTYRHWRFDVSAVNEVTFFASCNSYSIDFIFLESQKSQLSFSKHFGKFPPLRKFNLRVPRSE